MKLSAYLSKHGSKTELALAIGAQPQLIWQWATGVRPVPINRCMAIETATNGAVSRRDLRPDDWQEIWPELAQALANTAQPATETIAPAAEYIQPDAMRSGLVRRHDSNRRGVNPDYDGGRRETGPFPPIDETTVVQGVANV